MVDYRWAGLAVALWEAKLRSVVVSQGPLGPVGVSSSELGIGATDQPGRVKRNKIGSIDTIIID